MRMLNLTATLVALSLTALIPTLARADNFGMRLGGDGVSIGIDIGNPPPAVVVVPPRPAIVWMPGYWSWDGYRQVWVTGQWVEQRPNYVVAPGRWEAGPRWYGAPQRHDGWDNRHHGRHGGWEHRHHGRHGRDD